MFTTNPLLNAEHKQIIGNLLVEILQGEISDDTRRAIAGLNADEISEPYQHLVSYTQGWAQDNVKLAYALRTELRTICEELENTDDSHNQ